MDSQPDQTYNQVPIQLTEAQKQSQKHSTQFVIILITYIHILNSHLVSSKKGLMPIFPLSLRRKNIFSRRNLLRIVRTTQSTLFVKETCKWKVTKLCLTCHLNGIQIVIVGDMNSCWSFTNNITWHVIYLIHVT